MKKVLYIGLGLLFAVSCGPRRIDRADMEEIMYQILIQDQQIKHDATLKPQADTSLVYEGIFESFGYNTDDFLFSLEYYLEDPTRLEKVMQSVGKRLDGEIDEVSELLDAENWRKKMMAIYLLQRDTTLPHPRGRVVDSLPLRFTGDTMHMVVPQDSLPAPHPDSLLFVEDTLLSVRDSL
mgnify:CR=1 FL=1